MPKLSYDVNQQNEFLRDVSNFYNDVNVLTNEQIRDYVEKNNLPFPHFLFRDKNRKVGRGKYNVSMSVVQAIKPLPPFPPMKKSISVAATQAEQTPTVNVSAPTSMRADISLVIPERDATYVPFGNYADIEKIISSKIFFPVYITGLSGNGKTMSISQACAKLKRQLLRINVTEETDELDLLGGTELVNGNTVFREGAVLLAMRAGAVLLIDEGDLNNTKILCLMPILEGKPYLNKKTGEVVHPAPGFNIFITGNTKGKGSEDGRFVGTKVMNEAFLERFSITMEQEYPNASTEKKIVLKNMEQLECVDDAFATHLCTWAEIIRKAFDEGSINDLISTRRLVHIIKTYSIFGDRMKAIELCLNRFDRETKNSFMDFYKAIDASVNGEGTVDHSAGTPEVVEKPADEVSF